MQIQLLHANGNIAPGIPLSVTINGDNALLMHSGSYTSDENGLITVKQYAMRNMNAMHVIVKTDDTAYTVDEQTTEIHTVHSLPTRRGSSSQQTGFLLIKNINYDTLKVGQLFQADIVVEDSSFTPTHMFVMVITRGQIVKLEQISGQQKFMVTIERHMVPSIRLVAIAVVNNVIISDSIYLSVYEEGCALDVELETSGSDNITDSEPGASCTFNIQGSAGDVVSLIGVDEAVHILAKDTRLSQRLINDDLNGLDLGCGAGDGIDTEDILLNAGIIALGADYAHGSNCNRHNSRNKRQAPTNSTTPLEAKYTGRRKKCCILGLRNGRKSCSDSVTILKRHLPNDQECYKAFQECCQDIEASPVRTMSIPGSTQYQATSKIPITYDWFSPLSPFFIRLDFIQTFLL